MNLQINTRPLARATVRRRWAALLLCLACAALAAGCGGSQAAPADPPALRTPHPTFTPAPPQAAAPEAGTESAAADGAAATPQAAAPAAQATGVRGKVNTQLVNIRRGPGTDAEVITILAGGEEYDVIGKNEAGDWLQVCCVDQEYGWLSTEFVDVSGDLAAVPVAQPGGPSGPAAEGASTEGASTEGAAAAPAVQDPPKATVNTALVNARSGAGTEFGVVKVVEAGEVFDIVGKDESGTWWQVCCVEGQQAWLTDEFVDISGNLDALNNPPAAEAAAPAEISFDLEAQEQFPESSTVRIYLFANNAGAALAGYGLKVTKDGVDQPASGTSFAGQPGFTWPLQDARQRSQNLKLEFPGVEPAGTWQVTLVNRDGQPVGPPATFTLAANDTELELYVRYKKK